MFIFSSTSALLLRYTLRNIVIDPTPTLLELLLRIHSEMDLQLKHQVIPAPAKIHSSRILLDFCIGVHWNEQVITG